MSYLYGTTGLSEVTNALLLKTLLKPEVEMSENMETEGSQKVENGSEVLLPTLSKWSTPAILPSAWCSTDFLVGAGMVIIQQNTHKIVMIHAPDWERKWFFPRGRKDVGETIEQAALREAFEESGYRAQLLPLLNPTTQPFPPASMGNIESALNVEPIFLTTTLYNGVYLTSWFVGQIPEDAAVDTSRERMPSEENFQTHLLSYEEAMQKVNGSEIDVLQYAWDIYQKTLEFVAERRAQDISNIYNLGSGTKDMPSYT
ncbi:Diadenosine hexaphosphate hydrolase [Psilocybe cubensis]|uniref:Diadenosine hexaphosphate hydrolase n=2 Tax=Psilocybe cubensis TaxID=181762 RepID=A0ACB8HHQ9_PSICU|nr:Diadenosine hexaphosphate hydrolase [Psilocybe cubensis]KAH9487227.1 Diadenosine hexaphosphate hydrolase [Psilocybe cubensis]